MVPGQMNLRMIYLRGALLPFFNLGWNYNKIAWSIAILFFKNQEKVSDLREKEDRAMSAVDLSIDFFK